MNCRTVSEALDGMAKARDGAEQLRGFMRAIADPEIPTMQPTPEETARMEEMRAAYMKRGEWK